MGRYLVLRPFRTHRTLQAGELVAKGIKFPPNSLRGLLSQGRMKEITDVEAETLIRSKAEARSQSRTGKEPINPNVTAPRTATETEEERVSTSVPIRPAAQREGI